MLEINFSSFRSFKYMYKNTDTHMVHSTSHLQQCRIHFWPDASYPSGIYHRRLKDSRRFTVCETCKKQGGTVLHMNQGGTVLHMNQGGTVLHMNQGSTESWTDMQATNLKQVFGTRV